MMLVQVIGNLEGTQQINQIVRGPEFSRLYIPTEEVYYARGLYGADKEVVPCYLSTQKGAFELNSLFGKLVSGVIISTTCCLC